MIEKNVITSPQKQSQWLDSIQSNPMTGKAITNPTNSNNIITKSSSSSHLTRANYFKNNFILLDNNIIPSKRNSLSSSDESEIINQIDEDVISLDSNSLLWTTHLDNSLKDLKHSYSPNPESDSLEDEIEDVEKDEILNIPRATYQIKTNFMTEMDTETYLNIPSTGNVTNNDNNRNCNSNWLKPPIKQHKTEKHLNLDFNSFWKTLSINSRAMFTVFSFWNSEDWNQFYSVSKKCRMIMNTVFTDIYSTPWSQKWFKDKEDLKQLGATLLYSRVKNSLKIELMFLIGFHATSRGESKNFTPKNIGFILFYRYLNSKYPEKYLDYYSFDWYPCKDEAFPSVYMIREFTSFTWDHLQKPYIQPVLPFKVIDNAVINIQILSTQYNFVNPNKISSKCNSNTIQNIRRDARNPRVCEYEDICLHWKNISFLKHQEIVVSQIKKIFEPYFRIWRILFDDVGYLIFKVMWKAHKVGEITNKEELGIKLVIRDRAETVTNEIKKNNLMFENKVIFELRLGDMIVFYLTNNRE